MLEARGLKKMYPASGNQRSSERCAAVNGVDLILRDGEAYALVGESGSGKSTLSKLLMGLLPPTEGDVLLDGVSIVPGKRKKQINVFSQIQLVLQDGKSALDPRFTVYDSVAEPIRNFLNIPKEQERKLVSSLLARMELDDELSTRKPGELSGGQQKRVCIARALAVSPRCIIFDEAVSSLDVIVRNHILRLLKRIQAEQRCTYLFITHDIDVALYLAGHIFVMNDGRIVEGVDYTGDISSFTHPYSQLLLESLLPANGAP